MFKKGDLFEVYFAPGPRLYVGTPLWNDYVGNEEYNELPCWFVMNGAIGIVLSTEEEEINCVDAYKVLLDGHIGNLDKSYMRCLRETKMTKMAKAWSEKAWKEYMAELKRQKFKPGDLVRLKAYSSCFLLDDETIHPVPSFKKGKCGLILEGNKEPKPNQKRGRPPKKFNKSDYDCIVLIDEQKYLVDAANLTKMRGSK